MGIGGFVPTPATAPVNNPPYETRGHIGYISNLGDTVLHALPSIPDTFGASSAAYNRLVLAMANTLVAINHALWRSGCLLTKLERSKDGRHLLKSVDGFYPW